MVQMNSMQFRSVVEPLLNDVFDGIYDELPREYSQIYKTEKALPRRFQEDPILAGFGSAVLKPEGQAVTYDAGREAYRVRFVQKVYALAYAMTEELVEDGDHISIGTVYSEHLARAIDEAVEIVHANVLNNATSASYPGGDGVALLSTAHPLSGGGTFSNTLATAADISEASLEQLCIQVRTAVDERNKQIGLKARSVITTPTNEFNAIRLLQSIGRPGTADNDPNALRKSNRLAAEPKIITRMTTAKMYFIETSAPRGLITKWRRNVRRAMEGDFETGSMRHKASVRFECKHVDPRCLYGHQGT